MHAKRFGRGLGPNQFAPEYHLARPVQCPDCGVHLHKDHFYVSYGNRCHPCWQASITAVVPVESADLVTDTAADIAYEEEYTHGTYSQV